jgi:hypothetical protein
MRGGARQQRVRGRAELRDRVGVHVGACVWCAAAKVR